MKALLTSNGKTNSPKVVEMSAFTSEIPTIFLDPGDRAPALARDFVAAQFREWGSADDFVARLVVCELVTNSWRHGEGQIILRVFRDVRADLAVIEVWDQGEGLPVVARRTRRRPRGGACC